MGPAPQHLHPTPAADALLLWLPPQAAATAVIRVSAIDAAGAVTLRGELDLAPAAVASAQRADLLHLAAAARSVRAVLPAEDLLCLTVEAPPMSARQARKAVPGLVEEYLACELEAVQVAAGPREGPRLRVAVVAHERIVHWLDRLAAHGIGLDGLVPEPLGLGAAPGEARVMVHADRWVFDVADHAGGALSGPVAPRHLARLLEERPPRRLELCCTAPAGPADVRPEPAGTEWRSAVPVPIAEVCAAQGIELALTRLDEEATCWLSRRLAAGADMPDFLHGPHQRRRRVHRSPRGWLLAGVAAGLLLLVTGTNAVLGLQAARLARQDMQAALAVYRTVFPEEAIDARALPERLRARVAAAGAPPPPSAAERLHHALAPLQAPAQANEAGLRSLVFDRGAGRLVLQALFARVDQAEAYRRSVDRPDWPAWIEDVRPAAEAVEARVRFGREESP